MNGSNGIVPTVDLATNNAYPYPMYGYGNNGGFFGSEGIWALVLLAMLFGNGWGGFGGFGGGFGAGFGLADGGLLGYAIGNNATKGDLSDGLFSIQNGNKLDNLSTQVSDGFTNVATNLCNGRSGNYSAKEDSMKSLEFMLESAVDLFKMLREEASSPEEKEMIEKYAKKISER